MNSMFSRLMLSACILVFLLLLLLWQWLDYSHSAQLARVQQSLHRELAGHMAHINPLLASGNISDAALKEAFHDFMLLGPSFEIYTLTPSGDVVAYSAPETKIVTRQVALPPIKAFLRQQPLPITGTDPRALQRDKIFSATELHHPDGQLSGYLYVIIGGEAFDGWQQIAYDTHQRQTWLVSLLICALFALLLFALMLKFFTSPLSRLSRDVIRLNPSVSGKTAAMLPGVYQGSSEISALGTQINALLQKIHQQQQQMQAQQQAKQRFMLHLSHDLKTPLTALLGYLETWQLSPTQQRSDDLIQMATNTGQNLQQLLAQLLELIALENQTITPKFTTFALQPFLQELTQTFTPKAARRQIQLHFDAGENMVAFSDRQLLQRMLHNLVDNALRYTPTEGKISIQPVLHHSRWQLLVEDNGSGMHQDASRALNQPIAKAPQFSEDDPLPQLGVGLAIVRHLATMLDCPLEIDSEPDQGCRIYLALKLQRSNDNTDIKKAP